VKRFVLDREQFVLISQVSPELETKPKPTHGLEVYDQAFYERSHGKEAVRQFISATKKIERLCSARGWALDLKFNKYYAGFKYGNKVCFSVHWGGTHAWYLALKVAESVARKAKAEGWEFQRYEEQWGQAVMRCLDPEKAQVSELGRLFEAAYRNIAGI
jgi:hypothetical protein